MSKQLNFAQQMDEVLKTLAPARPKLLLHACCGPCSSAVLEQLCQYFAALTNMRSVGVMGDERTYDYAIALRAVTTTDFMTAEVTLLPTETITTAANRIVNEVKHINRVLFDYTTKPPATIEFE